MAVFTSTKARQSLLKKGFIQADKDHHYFLYYNEGKVITKTKVSHNDQDIGDSLISKMYKQCQISKSQFFDLINCPLDEDGYKELLRQKDLIK